MNQFTLGVSACLLGHNVRYDGKNKLNWWLYTEGRKMFNLLPICPEKECGLPVPREPMHLEEKKGEIYLLGNQTQKDFTPLIHKWAVKKIEELKTIQLCGYVFKSKSPSCGLNLSLDSQGKIQGLWAYIFSQNFPFIPILEEKDLSNPKLREDFLHQVFRLQEKLNDIY